MQTKNKLKMMIQIQWTENQKIMKKTTKFKARKKTTVKRITRMELHKLRSRKKKYLRISSTT